MSKTKLLSKFELNTEQRTAANHIKGPLEIVAGPGTGKTHTLVARACHMIDAGIKPHHICIVTFTNKAAKELKQRVIEKTGDISKNLWATTFHGLGLRLLFSMLNKKKGDAIRIPNILDGAASAALLKNHITETCPNLILSNKVEIPFGKIIEIYNRSREAGSTRYISTTVTGINRQLFFRLIKEYEIVKKHKQAYDFTDLLYCIVNSPYRKQLRFRFKYVMVDEAHDMNRIQLEMVRMLARRNLCIIYDEDQCQPGDTSILTTNGYKRMDTLDPESDRLVSFISKEDRVGGLQNGFEFDIASRQYTGNMFKITCAGKQAVCTNNHQWLIKWSEAAKETNVVYLMKKDDNYRIGWCQLIKSDGSFHLGTRAQLEQADAAWILTPANSKKEASKWVSIFATKYNIPTVPFIPNGKTYYDEDTTAQIFAHVMPELRMGIRHLFTDLRLEHDYPIWSKQPAFEKQGGYQRFKTQAANLLPHIMDIPVYTHGQELFWATIDRIQSIPVRDEMVYSLDVHVGATNGLNSKTYICNNGLVTGNSIYEWRGANPKNIGVFRKLYPNCTRVILNKNYRSTTQIIEKSMNLIRHNTNRIEKHPVSIPGNGTEPEYKRLSSADEEANYIAKRIISLNKAGVSYNNITILYRANQQALIIEKILRAHGIPLRIQNGSSLYTRQSAKIFLAYLIFIVDTRNTLKLEEIINVPSRNIGTKTLQRLKDASQEHGISLWELLVDRDQRNKIHMPSSTKQKLDRFVGSITQAIESITAPTGMYQGSTYLYRAAILWIRRLFRDDKLMKEEESVIDTITDDILESTRNGDANSLQEWLLDVLLYSAQDVSVDHNCVNLYTMHSAKGLEFEVVFVVGMEQGICPWVSGRQIEQERKLAYVALTRAKQKLIITSAEQRFISGSVKRNHTSQFIAEIYKDKSHASDKSSKNPTKVVTV